MSKASEQMQQRGCDKETGNPNARCYCRVFVFFFSFVFSFVSQCTLTLPAGARWQLTSVWKRLEKILLSLWSRRPLLWKEMAPDARTSCSVFPAAG